MSNQSNFRSSARAMIRVLVICCVFVTSCSVYAQDDPAVVVLFGDSISVGYCSEAASCNGISFVARSGDGRTDYGFPTIALSELLNSSKRPSTVLNWGEGGSPSGPSMNGSTAFTNGVDRIYSVLDATKANHDGSQYFVMILYGTNDFGWGLSASDTGFNIRRIIQRAKDRGFTPVVGTLTPRTSQSVASRNEQIKNAASAESAALVDQFELFNAAGGFALLYDGLHPSYDGYNVIADNWFNQHLASAIEAQGLVISPIINLLLDD